MISVQSLPGVLTLLVLYSSASRVEPALPPSNPAMPFGPIVSSALKTTWPGEVMSVKNGPRLLIPTSKNSSSKPVKPQELQISDEKSSRTADVME